MTGPDPDVARPDPGGPGPDLAALHAPRSIAVVGASPRSTMAPIVRDNLVALGSPAACWFVNPNRAEAWGTPCHPSLADLPDVPDLVLIAVNPLGAAAVAEEAGALGVRALVIPGGGVVEGGAAAAAMQAAVRDSAVRHGMAVLGPNCMGLVDFTTSTAAYIDELSPHLRRGGIAAIAQSGSVANAFLMSGRRTGYSRVVSCGAEAVLDLCDHLAWSIDDPATHGIALFVEGFKRPERFLALADRARQLDKPVAVVKVGRSAMASAAALAHSGNLAGEDRVTDAALEAAGVIRCRDLDELLETVELIDGARRTGRRVGRGRTGLVTVSTGEASLVADLAEAAGLDLPALPEATRARVLAALPTMGFVANPLDPWGAAEAPEAYRVAFDALMSSGAYDLVGLVHDFAYASQASEVESCLEALEPLLAATAEPGPPGSSGSARPLPLVVSLTSGEPPPELLAALDAWPGGGRPPVLRGGPEAVAAIRHVQAWERRREERLAGEPRRDAWPALARDRTRWAWDAAGTPPAGPAGARSSEPAEAPGAAEVLTEAASLERLDRAGIPVAASQVVSTADEAVAALRVLGRPIALKLAVPGLAHKSDLGGVALDLADDAAVRAAAGRLLGIAAALTGDADPGRPPVAPGLLAQRMAEPGVELIIGGRRDPLFGPVVLVGLGGVTAEALDDVVLALAPIDSASAVTLLGRLRGARLLDGFRGGPTVDRTAVASILAAVSRLLADDPSIDALDANPVIAGPDGAVVVDALVVVREPRATLPA